MIRIHRVADIKEICLNLDSPCFYIFWLWDSVKHIFTVISVFGFLFSSCHHAGASRGHDSEDELIRFRWPNVDKLTITQEFIQIMTMKLDTAVKQDEMTIL